MHDKGIESITFENTLLRGQIKEVQHRYEEKIAELSVIRELGMSLLYFQEFQQICMYIMEIIIDNTINGGTGIDLGTATFSIIKIQNVVGYAAAGTTLFSGLVDSGNIASGGNGTVFGNSLGGPGTILAGINPHDALWAFSLNTKRFSRFILFLMTRSPLDDYFLCLRA